MHLIIDADPMVYRSGFAAQKTVTHVIAEDASGRLSERYFRGEAQGAQKAEWLTRYKLTELSIDKIVEPEPVSHALHLVKQEVDGIKAAVKRKYPKEKTQEAIVLLSGPGNYRCVLATLKPYKGNRDPEHKPFHYQAIRDFITERGGIVIHGREADDEASIRAWQARRAGEKYLVATIDKDLDQIPGPHFDYRQKVFYNVSDEAARKWFWCQVLSGDATDNIGGAYRIGAAKAEAIVNGVLGTSDEVMWRAVLDAYRETTKLSGCPYHPDDVEDVALETARLVYMQQNAGELWNPPGVPMGTIGVGIDD